MADSIAQLVDADRLWGRLMIMAEFGARPDGGVDRPALSEAEIPARAQLVAWGRAIGLMAFTDAIGNLFLRLKGKDEALAPVLAGSHIDSQPTGGRFDGVYGVLAALEALEAIVASGWRPDRSIELVAWTNEEGSRFAPGMSGSTAFCTPAALPDILGHTDADRVSVEQALARILGSDVGIARRDLGRRPHCYIEAHIEQGPILESMKCPVGVVTGIQGTRRYRVRVTGKAAHAGTEPMATRRDALLAAVTMIVRVERAATAIDELKFTVGLFDVTPNAPSVVPEEVYFSIDIRHPDDAALAGIDAEIRVAAEAAHPCSVHVDQIAHAPTVAFAEPIQAVVTEAAATLGIASMPVYSAAGHDSRQLHYVCPTGMIFVPCRDGLSHNPAEWAEPTDLVAGTRVLTEALARLSRIDAPKNDGLHPKLEEDQDLGSIPGNYKYTSTT